MPHSAFCAVALLVGALAQPGAAPKPSVDEIVAATLKARGGVDALKGVVSLKRTGHVTLSGAPVAVTVWTKRPNLFRRETDLPGLRVILGYDGQTFWSSNGGDLPAQRVPGPASEQAQDEAAFESVLLDYKKKGHKVEFVGTEGQGERLFYHLKVVKKNGKTEHYYIDAKTDLEVRVVSTAQLPGSGNVEVTRELSDYRKVDGILVPFIVREFADGTLVSETTLESVEINPKLEDALFRMPSKGQ